MSCPISSYCIIAYLMFSSDFRKKKNCQMYLHTHTHTTVISQIFSFKQKLRKFPYKNFSFQYNKIVKLIR